MKQKKAKNGKTVTLRRTRIEVGQDYSWLSVNGALSLNGAWKKLGFPKLKPGESCKVRVTIKRVK